MDLINVVVIKGSYLADVGIGVKFEDYNLLLKEKVILNVFPFLFIQSEYRNLFFCSFSLPEFQCCGDFEGLTFGL